MQRMTGNHSTKILSPDMNIFFSKLAGRENIKVVMMLKSEDMDISVSLK